MTVLNNLNIMADSLPSTSYSVNSLNGNLECGMSFNGQKRRLSKYLTKTDSNLLKSVKNNRLNKQENQNCSVKLENEDYFEYEIFANVTREPILRNFSFDGTILPTGHINVDASIDENSIVRHSTFEEFEYNNTIYNFFLVYGYNNKILAPLTSVLKFVFEYPNDQLNLVQNYRKFENCIWSSLKQKNNNKLNSFFVINERELYSLLVNCHHLRMRRTINYSTEEYDANIVCWPLIRTCENYDSNVTPIANRFVRLVGVEEFLSYLSNISQLQFENVEFKPNMMKLDFMYSVILKNLNRKIKSELEYFVSCGQTNCREIFDSNFGTKVCKLEARISELEEQLQSRIVENTVINGVSNILSNISNISRINPNTTNQFNYHNCNTENTNDGADEDDEDDEDSEDESDDDTAIRNLISELIRDANTNNNLNCEERNDEPPPPYSEICNNVS